MLLVVLVVGVGISVMGLDTHCPNNALKPDRLEWQANLDGSEEAVEWLFGNVSTRYICALSYCHTYTLFGSRTQWLKSMSVSVA